MMDQNPDVDAWKKVHRQLTLALLQSHDNIAAELTKRRYLLEEMNRCKMQSTHKYASISSSSSSNNAKVKKKAAQKKVPPKKASPAVAGKATKVPSSSMLGNVSKASAPKSMATAKAPAPKSKAQPKLAGHKPEGGVIEGMAKTVSAPPSSTGIGVERSYHQLKDQSSQVLAEGGDVALHPNPNLQYSGITPQQMSQMYFPPAPYGMYGSMGMATPEQMSLAVQMMAMHQFHQNAENDGDNVNDTGDTMDSRREI